MSNYKIRDFSAGDKRSLHKFIGMNYNDIIYGGDSNYIPPLKEDLFSRFNLQSYPFFTHGKMRLFILESGSQVVGRISSHIDQQFVDYHKTKTGFFGFFECINDIEASKILFDNATLWAKENGMSKIIGPLSPTMSDEIGVLTEGFTPPVILTAYNPHYYQELYEKYNFYVEKTWFAWKIDTENYRKRLSELEKTTGNLESRFKVEIRKVNLKNYFNELKIIMSLYNDCWKDNWGFTPLTYGDIKFLGNKLINIIDPDMILFAYIDAKPVGVSVTVPNINEHLKDLRGADSVINLLKLIFRVKFKKVNSLRVLILGVLPEYRNRGISALLYAKTAIEVIKKGYRWGEGSLTLEDNWGINNVIKNADGVLYKKFNIYGKDL